jgi:hypothetical protein
MNTILAEPNSTTSSPFHTSTFNRPSPDPPAVRSAILLSASTIALALILSPATARAGTDTYTVAGSATWTCPPNVDSVIVECWGGGGAGGGAQRNSGSGSCTGGGGAGGAYSKTTVSVSPGLSYSLYVGEGGLGVPIANGNPGGNSSFAGSSAIAKGGAGGSAGVGAGGTYGAGGLCPAGSTGLSFLGGSGAAGASTYGGGGGGSGGTTNAGSPAINSSGGVGGYGGGAGANGPTAGGNGLPAPGLAGGGSGAYSTGSTERSGGAGTAGKVLVSTVAAECRSRQSGAWNDPSTWQTYNGTSWADATSTPKPNHTVYLQSGHTVTLQQNEACGDLHLAAGTTENPTAVGIIALQTHTLTVYGKFRCFTQTALDNIPGTSSTAGFSIYPFTATAGGKVSVVGNSRFLTVPGEWSANLATTSTGTFPLEMNLNPGQTATLATGLKFSSLQVNSGILDAAANRLAPDLGSVGTGDVTVNSGAVLRSAQSGNSAGNQAMSQTSTSRGGTLTVASGGKLVLGGNPSCIDMTAILLNGVVEYNKTNLQTFSVRSGLDSNAANPSTYTDLILSGTSQKTLWLNTTVNGTLMMAGNDSTVTLSLGGYTLTYGPASTLTYAAAVAQTTATSEFPASGSPHNLTISNANGVTLAASAARTISGTVTIARGTLSLGAGASLSYGPSATLAYAGSSPQTTANPEFPTSNGPFNLTLNNPTGVTLAAGTSRTINGTLTLVAGAFALGSGATLIYGPSATLAYAGSNLQTTASAEFPSVNGPLNLTINNSNCVSLAFSRSLGGTLTVAPNASLDFNGQSLTCGNASLVGALSMPVTKTGPNTFTGSRLTQTAGSLNYGGTLSLTANGDPLLKNDSIPLFNAANGTYAGDFTSITAPTLTTGLKAALQRLDGTPTGNIIVDCAGTLTAATAADTAICPGTSQSLHGSASLGSGTGYSFSWTSTPPGFTSTDADPTVSPTATTTYHLTVSDSLGCIATRDTVVTVLPPPAVANDAYDRGPGLSLKISKNDLVTNDTPGSVFARLPSLTTANNVTLAQNNAVVLYPANAPNLNDSFTYEITGPNGCTGVGTVIIHPVAGFTGGQVQTIHLTEDSVTLTFLGVPGYRYQVQRAATLEGAGDWADVGPSIVAPTADPAPGVFTYTDSLPTPPPATAYYRLMYVGSALNQGQSH